MRNNYLAKIDKIPNVSFNKEQKIIAKKILEIVSEKDLDAVYGLITQRVKTGFVFDEAPEVNHDCVAIIKENEKLNIAVNELNRLEHKLIIGENFDALKNLCATYIDKNGKGLIDVIYIDPPYNTEATKAEGNDYKEEITASKFIYRDKFTRDGWLNMMNERLKMARRLLSDNGVIFISIDDTEQAYLKVLCDTIFGEKNFVGMINCLDNLKGKENDSYLSYTSHYILIYSKIKNILGAFNYVPIDEYLEDKYKKVDSNGNCYTLNTFKKTGASKNREDRPSMFFPILEKNNSLFMINKEEYRQLYANGAFDDNVLSEICNKYKNDNYNIILPIDKNGAYLRWTSGYDNCRRLIDTNMLEYSNNSVYQKKYPKDIELIENSVYGTPKNFIYKKEFANGTTELNSIGLDFSNPKSLSLIKYLVKLIPNNEYATILDFFAGSGTTGQAVMELNAEDGGNRKFILVTNNENGIGENITRERLYRVINGKGSKGEIFDWTYSKDKPYLSDNSVRVFNIKYEPLSLTDLDRAEQIKEFTKKEFKKINEKYNLSNDFDVYNELSALCPYKEKEE